MGLAVAHVVQGLGVMGIGSTVTVQAHAKVNLALQVGPRREDRYHDLETVFMAVDLTDTVTCTSTDDGQIEVAVSGEGARLVPADGSDLAGRAARLLRDRFGSPELGVHLQIDKAIPVAGGMAGGSADAAAALRGCNDLWRLAVPEDELSALGAELGADVPFALRGDVALGRGRGDELTRLPCRGTYHWVFALAHKGLGTPAVFAVFDRLSAPPPRHSTTSLADALLAGDMASVGAALFNDLQPAAIHLRPELGKTLAAGAAMDGVLGAVLAGSGPTCAFLCESAEAADDVATRLAGLPQVASTRVAVGPAKGAIITNHNWVVAPSVDPALSVAVAADTAPEAAGTLDAELVAEPDSTAALDIASEDDIADDALENDADESDALEDDTSDAEISDEETADDETDEDGSTDDETSDDDTTDDDTTDDDTADDDTADEEPADDETVDHETADDETADKETADEEPADDDTSDNARPRLKWLRHHRAGKIATIIVLAVLLVLGSAIGIAYARLNGRITQQDITPMLGPDRPQRPTPTASTTSVPSSPIDPYALRAMNILVIGSDSRSNDPNMGQRSDTTFIAHVSADRRRIDLVSIPRDILITIPNCVYPDGSSVPGSGAKKQKFNAAFSFGSYGSKGSTASGAACAIRAVEAMSNVRIDGFAVVDFAGFQQIVDALGGVDIFLPCDVVSGVDFLSLAAGVNHLDGSTAIDYARARIGEGLGDGSDIMRIQRQQVLFEAIAMKAWSMNLMTSLPTLYNFVGSVADSVTTDLGTALQLAGFAYSLRSVAPENLTFNTIPIKGAKDHLNVEIVQAQAGPVWQALANDTPVSDVMPPKTTPPLRVEGLPTPPPGVVSAPPWQCGW